MSQHFLPLWAGECPNQGTLGDINETRTMRVVMHFLWEHPAKQISYMQAHVLLNVQMYCLMCVYMWCLWRDTTQEVSSVAHLCTGKQITRLVGVCSSNLAYSHDFSTSDISLSYYLSSKKLMFIIFILSSIKYCEIYKDKFSIQMIQN